MDWRLDLWRSPFIRRSAVNSGLSLAATVTGLALVLAESGGHKACVAILRDTTASLGAAPNCGFADTTYWAGIVVLVAGALALIGFGGTAIRRAAGIRSATEASSWSRARTNNRLAWNGLLAHGAAGDFASGAGSEFRALPALPTNTTSAAGLAAVLIDAESWDGQASTLQPAGLPAPPAAWYPDPERAGWIRWWDGVTWGESRPDSSAGRPGPSRRADYAGTSSAT